MMKLTKSQKIEIFSAITAVLIMLIVAIVPSIFEDVSSYLSEVIQNRSAWFGAALGTSLWILRRLSKLREHS